MRMCIDALTNEWRGIRFDWWSVRVRMRWTGFGGVECRRIYALPHQRWMNGLIMLLESIEMCLFLAVGDVQRPNMALGRGHSVFLSWLSSGALVVYIKWYSNYILCSTARVSLFIRLFIVVASKWEHGSTGHTSMRWSREESQWADNHVSHQGN